MMDGSKVFYVCFYAEPEFKNEVISYPSVWSKIDYVVSALKSSGKSVTQLCIAPSKNNRIKGIKKEIDEYETHIYLSNRSSKCYFIQVINTLIYQISILKYLLKNVKKEDEVLIYHSLFHRRWLWIYKHIFKRKYILEIEDVFSEISPSQNKHRNCEWELIHSAEAYLCINDLVAKKLDVSKKAVISYGSYELPPVYQKEIRNEIRLVYAGVIEQERRAAFLAVEAICELPDNYELHILGFGKEEDILCLKKYIEETNKKKGKEAVFWHGRKQGEEYYRFLQNCDIALSTHSYDEKNMNSAEYTFPSKILVYLANGLSVVAQQLECLEISMVGDLLYYYKYPSAEMLAETIRKIKLDTSNAGRKRIEQLDTDFKKKIRELL